MSFMKLLLNWFRKKTESNEYNRFIVTVNTNAQFLIKYPQKDHTPKIGECLSGNWNKIIHIVKRRKLFIEVICKQS